jgi:hypothetical protein
VLSFEFRAALHQTKRAGGGNSKLKTLNSKLVVEGGAGNSKSEIRNSKFLRATGLVTPVEYCRMPQVWIEHREY